MDKDLKLSNYKSEVIVKRKRRKISQRTEVKDGCKGEIERIS